MTRRLALAILFSVWGILIVGGITAYLSVRSILIDDLDALLYARAVALPELVRYAGFDESRTPQYDWNDVYTIAADPARPTARATEQKPEVIHASFTASPAGPRLRTLVVAAHGKIAAGKIVPVRVTYSGPTLRMDRILYRTGWALALFGVAVGLVAAAVAAVISRVALRPLKSTALAIAGIDEQRLGKRISTDALPEELLPVAGRLNEMLGRLEQAFTGQKLFLANVSHELRTPVAALATALEITLRQPRDADTYRHTLGQSLVQVQVLRTLVDRLMEYISNDTAEESSPEVLDAAVLIGQCADAAQTIGNVRQVTVTRTLPSELLCRITAGRLRSIAMNLLANAVEHNRPGGTVDVTAFHDGQQLHLRVADTGPGIAAEHLPHLFTPFYRADKARRQEDGHLGLGLFFVQSHVKAMGGQVRVDSRIGQGSQFVVEIPCPRATPGPVAVTHPRQRTPLSVS